MSDSRDRQYTNGEITVFWKPAKCIHATTCFRELIEVFNPGRRPWVNMNGAPTRRIIEVVNKCPTQALEWKRNEDLSPEEQEAQFLNTKEELTPETLPQGAAEPENEVVPDVQTPSATLKIMPDGPIVVEGVFSVVDGDGTTLRQTPMTSICRCGKSHSMPYCDGTHRKIGFTDEK
ncbi:MAG: (4Fe-4S)-binding protein [Bacteroidales bacterium]